MTYKYMVKHNKSIQQKQCKRKKKNVYKTLQGDPTHNRQVQKGGEWEGKIVKVLRWSQWDPIVVPNGPMGVSFNQQVAPVMYGELSASEPIPYPPHNNHVLESPTLKDSFNNSLTVHYATGFGLPGPTSGLRKGNSPLYHKPKFLIRLESSSCALPST